MLISYIAAAAFKNILRHILKDLTNILQRLPRRRNIFFIKCKLSTSKTTSKIIENLPMVCMVCTLPCYEGPGDLLP